jgi:flagellar motor protein MotB
VAYLVKAPRVGRSQGAVIFWGLVSAFFASAFCYYYLENRSNEEKNRTLVEQVMILQGERDSFNSERQKMETAASDTEKQLNEREQFLQEKENNLAEEESQIEATGSHNQPVPSAAQAEGLKKFDDAVRKIVAKVPDADVVVRGGRPVLRLPNSLFFDPGDDQLKPDGKNVLNLVAQATGGAASRLELHVETFTDSGGETLSPPGSTGKPTAPATIDAWTLTAERAAAIAHDLRDAGVLPFQNVIAVGRADFLPIEPGANTGHARNRRVEITITPVPAPFHAPEPVKAARAKSAAPTPAAAAVDNPANTGAP